MDGVRTFAVHELAMTAMVSAMKKTDSRKLILRSLDQVVAPQGGEQAVIFVGVQGVLVEPLFPTGKGSIAGFPADLPTDGIAAEKSCVTSVSDEFLETVPHRGGPVFVMADAEDEPVVFEYFGAQLEIHVAGVFQFVTVAFRPSHERFFPIVEYATGRTTEGYPVSL